MKEGLDEEGGKQLGMLADAAAGQENVDGDGECDEDGEDEDKDDDEDDEDEDGDGWEEKNKEEEEEEDEEDGMELDQLSDVSIDADSVPHQKVVIDNETALSEVRHEFQLDPSLPWTETLVCPYPTSINEEVQDVNDDINRELAFYKQALHSALQSKQLASSSSPPLAYTRPSDYYAEMVKSDAHMARIRQKLIDEKSQIKVSEQKKKERAHKKVGKQVQLEKLKERKERGKREVEMVKGVKRKHANMEDPTDFDVTVEDEPTPNKRQRKEGGRGGGGDGGKKLSRKSRDAKFGFGHKVGRRAKQNTRESTEQIFGGGGGGGKGKRKGPGGGMGGKKGKPQRPGKSRRENMRSKK